MNEWLLGIGITTGVAVGVAAFTRFLPKAKLIAWAQIAGDKLGKALSAILLLRLGRKAADSVEEGVIVTLLATVQAFVDYFGKGLVYDNQDRQVGK